MAGGGSLAQQIRPPLGLLTHRRERLHAGAKHYNTVPGARTSPLARVDRLYTPRSQTTQKSTYGREKTRRNGGALKRNSLELNVGPTYILSQCMQRFVLNLVSHPNTRPCSSPAITQSHHACVWSANPLFIYFSISHLCVCVCVYGYGYGSAGA